MEKITHDPETITLQLTRDQIQIVLYALNNETTRLLDKNRTAKDYQEKQQINTRFLHTVDAHSTIIDQSKQHTKG